MHQAAGWGRLELQYDGKPKNLHLWLGRQKMLGMLTPCVLPVPMMPSRALSRADATDTTSHLCCSLVGAFSSIQLALPLTPKWYLP